MKYIFTSHFKSIMIYFSLQVSNNFIVIKEEMSRCHKGRLLTHQLSSANGNYMSQYYENG